ncbi:PREDICTED: protein CASC1 isoform X2 [Galeopterus variegatus]|uniref:Dynein axonemal intermediate chain 7 n=1 Tax=Galeopterus variegatus TaxID=482537 RepID=A0ABM0RMM3_GALVR|nr:PREDICTED: protein CASC1 isoform X2 [Galeopterus variegatus]
MERLEIQRIEKEKWLQLEEKDLGRRNEELDELNLLEGCFPEAERLKHDTRLLSQWKHYIQCDGSPDPSISQEINTFISLWREETNETFEEVIAKSKLVLNQASTLADLDSGNMEKIIRDENVTLYVWANLKKNPRYRSVRFSGTQIGFEIPRILATSDIALRLLHTHYDHVSPLHPVLTPVPKEERTSTVTELVRDEVKNVEEAISKEDQEETKQQESGSNIILEEEIKVEEQDDIEVQKILKEGLQKYTYPPETTEEFETENAFPPIEVTLEVHENVIFFEDPIVVRWDTEGKRWKTDGISKVSYNPEERLITFSLETFGPVTLIQDTHINMPYQSWELRPLGVNTVLLTVTTVFTEIQIQIKENLCMLASIKLRNKEHFSILEGKWMPPVPFIIALKAAGLNIFPTGHSHFYVVINHKVPLVEMKAYRQMALLSSAFAFGWSKWNLLCNSTKVVVKVREHLTKEPMNPDWDLLMFSGDRAQRLKIDEDSQTFSEALKEETEFHSTLYHMVKDFASEEAMEKVSSSDCQFIDCVCQMLLSTRLLSYS